MSDCSSDDSYNPDSSSETEPVSKNKRSNKKRNKRPRATPSQCEACGASFKYTAAFEKHVARGCAKTPRASVKRRGKESCPETEAAVQVLPDDEISSDDDSPLPRKSKKYKKLDPEEKNLRALRRKYDLVKNKLLNNPITRFALNHRAEPATVAVDSLAGIDERFGSASSLWASDLNFGSWLRKQGLLTEYLQHATVRVNFQSDVGAPQEVSLQPLEARVLDFTHADTLINAAGPVWSCGFRPAHGLPDENKFFTVALSRIGWPMGSSENKRTLCGEIGVGSDYRHTIEDVSSFPNVLQLWEAPSALLAGHGKDLPPQIAYGIAFNSSGPIWRSVWSPHRLSGSVPALGIAAVLGGDGCVRVIALPYPPRSYEQSAVAMQGVSGADRLSKVLLVQEERVRLRLLSWTCLSDRYTAVAWDAQEPLQLLCGHADGTITIWKLNLAVEEGT